MRPFAIIVFFLILFQHSYVEAKTRVKINDVSRAGDALQYVLPAYGLALTLGYRDADGAYELLETSASTIVTTEALKYLVQSKRPDGGKLSFPSGHTSIAFAASGFIHVRYGLPYALPAYIAASFVGYSRVSCHYHWTRDVIAGALIGLIYSRFFTSPLPCDVYPSIDSDSASICFEGTF